MLRGITQCLMSDSLSDSLIEIEIIPAYKEGFYMILGDIINLFLEAEIISNQMNLYTEFRSYQMG